MILNDSKMILLKEVKLPFINHVLKSTKNSSVKTKRNNMRTLHVQLLFQAVTKNYSIQRTASKNTHTILAPFILLVSAALKGNQEMIGAVLKENQGKRNSAKITNQEI